MKINTKFLTMLAVFALLAFVPLALAEKGGKKPPPPPPPGPSNPAIAYSEPQNNPQWDLMVMDADGTNQRVVMSRKFTDNVAPSWSPDGKQLVFRMDDRRGDEDGICIINVDGSGLKKILTSGHAGNPAWSPVELAGRYWITFSDNVVLPDGTLKRDRDIFMVDTDGNNLTQLTNTDVGEWETTWSFTGDRIAVHTYDADSGVSDIVLYQVDCTDRTCAATNLGSVIYVTDSPLALSNDVGGADWARSHNRLAFTAQMVGGGPYDLWTLDLETGVFQQLTDTPQNSEHDASWLPDDSGVMFGQGPDGGLWVMAYDPDTGVAGDPRLIVTPQQAGTPFFWGPKWRRNK